MRIQEASKLTGLSKKTIHFYVNEGLIHPKKLENNYYEFSEQDITLLQQIRIFRKAGLSIQVIKEIYAYPAATNFFLHRSFNDLKQEIAEKMGNISPEKVREIQKIALEPVSLETPIGEEDDSHLGDFIEDKEATSPDEYANNQLLKDEINNVLKGLTEREEKVLRLRFGLLDGRTRTLEEVDKEFNVTRERIRQIEAKALRKLKHPTRSKRLRDFVDKN